MATREALVFEDTYTGPRWRYGMFYRPISAANIPKGWIIFSDRLHPGFKYGTIDYPFELDEATARRFDLIALGAVEDR